MLHQNPTTVPSLLQDFPEWRRGRRRYAVWLIDVCCEESLRKVEAAREHLSEFLLKPYARQPHITLFVCGFPAEAPRFDDDYTTHQFHAQSRLLRESKLRPFLIELGNLNSFASAPFLEVSDLEGGIAGVRSLLSSAGREIGRDTFTPHLTVGLYSGSFRSTVVGRRIADFSGEPVRLKVDRITFASYEAREIGGALDYHSTIVLSP